MKIRRSTRRRRAQHLRLRFAVTRDILWLVQLSDYGRGLAEHPGPIERFRVRKAP